MYKFSVAVFVHILAFGLLREQEAKETVLVKINQGSLQGTVETSEATGRTFYRFVGIPYAKPPVGSLRFKGPRDADPWTGVRDATNEGAACVQRRGGSEDCLFVNVLTPELPGSSSSSSLKPVLVWVHGGAYQMLSGAPSIFRPDYLLARDVVFVSMNYRLGVLGFLSLEGSDAPGNVGLKDQVAALRWVKANIDKFGGDPSQVTLWGESAGGSAVHHHVLSPLSEGLFHSAISDSGAAMNPTAFFASTRDRAFRLGEFLGLSTNNSQELVDFLRGVSAERLVASQDKGLLPEEAVKPLAAAFIPTTEYFVEGEEMFLVGSPWELTMKGQFKKIPYITGVNKDEGIIAYAGCDSLCLSEVNRDFERVLPLNLGLQKGSERSRRIAAQVRQFYFKDSEVSAQTKQNYIDLQTDIMYAYGCHYVVNHSVAHDVPNVFNYQFVYEGKLGSARHNAIAPGVAHGDELRYIFYQGQDEELQADPKDMDVVNTTVTMWTNFVKTGNPSILNQVTWKDASQDHHYYLKIDATPTLQENLNEERMAFWDGIYTSLGFENIVSSK